MSPRQRKNRRKNDRLATDCKAEEERIKAILKAFAGELKSPGMWNEHPAHGATP